MTEKTEWETSQSGDCHGYRVQARVSEVSPTFPITYIQPNYGEKRLILTDKWTDIHPFEGLNPAGVPKSRIDFVSMAYLLDKRSAVALAYTFAAQHNEFSAKLQIRIVKYKVKYSLNYGPTEDIIQLDDHLYEFERERKQPEPVAVMPKDVLKEKLGEEWFSKHKKLVWDKFLQTKSAQKIIKEHLDQA